jgi:hypothetical protein
MFRLTIDAGGSPIVSEHPDWPTAHRRLIGYVKTEDYYLELIQSGRSHTSYDLLDLGDVAEERRRRAQGRHPRIVGRAFIEELSPRQAVDPPICAAAAARQPLWAPAGDTDAGTRNPLAVLTRGAHAA